MLCAYSGLLPSLCPSNATTLGCAARLQARTSSTPEYILFKVTCINPAWLDLVVERCPPVWKGNAAIMSIW
jgi:hypothetical protein